MRQLKITTPDQVAFHLVVAGLACRAAAWLQDQAIIFAIRLALFVVFVFAELLADGALRVYVALFMVIDVVYFIYYEWARNGETPGKRRFRLRVISLAGGRLSFRDVLIRNVIRMLDSLPMFMLVGGVSAFFDPLGRRLGDLAAGTMVIRERDGALSLPPTDRDRPNSYRDNPACRRRILSRARKEDRDLAIELMWRRDKLSPEAREAIFSRLAAEFRTRFGLPEDGVLSDEQTVMDVLLLLVEGDA